VAGAVELGKDLDHGGGGPGRLDTAVVVLVEAARGGLLLVFDKEDLMDDRGGILHGKGLERVGDRAGDEVCMGGLALDDDAEGDDAGGGLEFEDGPHGDRDLKGPGDADEIHAGLRQVVAQLVDDVVHQGVGKALVVLRGNDRDAVALGADDPRLRWEGGGHGGRYGGRAEACQSGELE
jgi:hypothetical protein